MKGLIIHYTGVSCREILQVTLEVCLSVEVGTEALRDAHNSLLGLNYRPKL